MRVEVLLSGGSKGGEIDSWNSPRYCMKPSPSPPTHSGKNHCFMVKIILNLGHDSLLHIIVSSFSVLTDWHATISGNVKTDCQLWRLEKVWRLHKRLWTGRIDRILADNFAQNILLWGPDISREKHFVFLTKSWLWLFFEMRRLQ